MRMFGLILPFALLFLFAGTSIQTQAPNAPQLGTVTATVVLLPSATASIEEEQSESIYKLTPKAALERLFSGETLVDEWFSPNFRANVSVVQVDTIIVSLKNLLGDYVRVDGESSPFTVVFELGTVSTDIALGRKGEIVGLFFYTPTLTAASLDEAIAQVRDLPGDISVYVAKNGEEVASLNGETPLAVGSAFKLAVLLALSHQIEAGDHAWDEVVLLKSAWKNLPTGILQNWPDDSPLTIHTLASLMISLSDNTAADALIDIVGRETVEVISPRNRPFLKVQELTKLKTVDTNLLARYRNGGETKKRELLATLADMPLPTPEEIARWPILDVEWFFTGPELCDLLAQVEDLDLMTIEPGPGVMNPEQWVRVAYKGGSELGVMNLTTWLENVNGDNYCVTMTRNLDFGGISEDQFITHYRTLINVLE